MSLFITIEGGEGSGKTTCINKVIERLTKEGYEVVSTREPGGIEISEQIRDVILDVNNTKMDPRTEALLYAASRRQHLVEKIIPALNENKIIVCDRFLDSSLAYQGYARGLGIDLVYDINRFAIDGKLPDLTLLFDLDPRIGLARIGLNKQREVNRLDLEALEFHDLVREGFLTLAKRESERIKVIDANREVDVIVDEVYGIVKEALSKYHDVSR